MKRFAVKKSSFGYVVFDYDTGYSTAFHSDLNGAMEYAREMNNREHRK